MVNRILRVLQRRFNTFVFKLKAPSVRLDGEGLVSHINCVNSGSGNVVHLEAGGSLTDCCIIFKGNNNHLYIPSSCHFRNIEFYFEDNNNEIRIGRRTSMESGCQLAAVEGKKISIGEDCMLSNQIYLRTTDSHSILDDSGRRTNPGADIFIGNHVWIGFQSLILKGVTIPDDCIIGARSMVTASLKAESHDLVAGSPAKVLRNNINWKRERIAL